MKVHLESTSTLALLTEPLLAALSTSLLFNKFVNFIANKLKNACLKTLFVSRQIILIALTRPFSIVFIIPSVRGKQQWFLSLVANSGCDYAREEIEPQIFVIILYQFHCAYVNRETSRCVEVVHVKPRCSIGIGILWGMNDLRRFGEAGHQDKARYWAFNFHQFLFGCHWISFRFFSCYLIVCDRNVEWHEFHSNRQLWEDESTGRWRLVLRYKRYYVRTKQTSYLYWCNEDE